MFSGEDSSGEGVNARNQYGQFQIASQTAAACGLKTTTTPSGSIDWASLAQQWIQMRDFSGADINSTIPDAPPPPNISGNYQTDTNINGNETENSKDLHPRRTKFDEQGEADMEMDDDDDNDRLDYKSVQIVSEPVVPITQIVQPNWFMPRGPSIPPETNVQQGVNTQWNHWPSRVLMPPVPIARDATSSTAHIPPLMKMNISDPNILQSKSIPDSQNDFNTNSTMDAAKRKILPAWIREGLEKMEREKQKQLEKQQTPQDSANDCSFDEQTSFSSQLMVNSKVPTHLDSDNSSFDEEDDNERTVIKTATARACNRVNSPLPDSNAKNITIRNDTLKIGKSYEQKLSELMIVVRKTLTEMLLEVTNQEISNVAHETIQSHKSKATTAHVIPKSAISTITGKLGLAAYGDSASDSSDGETVESSNNVDCFDSEEELRTSIKSKRKAFAKISEEIEECLLESAMQEEQKLKFYSQQEEELQRLRKPNDQESDSERLDRAKSSGSNNNKGQPASTIGKGYDKEFGETSQSKLQISNGKRQKDRTTRFSDNKDSRGASIITAADYISQYKCSQIENAAQKINSTVLLNLPLDGSNRSTIEPTSKSFDAARSAAMQLNEENSTKANRGKSRKTSNQSSDDNESSSDDSNTSDSSNTSHCSSKHSRKSSSRHKSNRNHHHYSSSSSKRKSDRDYSRDRYNNSSKRSRRRYRSSDSDDFSDDKHKSSSRNYHRHRLSHRYECKSRRTRSRSRSRSRSTYSSSSRRRH